jgi:hypothetical protein
VPNKCCYRGFQPLTTFASRVHTHALGRAVWLTDDNGTAGAALVHRGDPQLPQVGGAGGRQVLGGAAAGLLLDLLVRGPGHWPAAG